MNEPIISVGREQNDTGWVVHCYVSFLKSEDDAIKIENLIMSLMCSEEITNQ